MTQIKTPQCGESEAATKGNRKSKTNLYKFSFPANLIADILGHEGEEPPTEYLSRDCVMGLTVALSYLTDRERNILLLRYQYGFTLEQVAEKFSLTRERIRQISFKALKKLQHPTLIPWVAEGVNAHIETVTNAKAEKKIHAALRDHYLRGYQEGRAASKVDAEAAIYGVPAETLLMPVAEFDFSVRTYNCLVRAGVQVARDILDFDSDEKIRSIRNLGRKSAAEIATKLGHYGICTDIWAGYLPA